MPYVNVKLAAPHDSELSARLAREVGELTTVCLHKDPTVTAVAVEYVDPRHWFIGGESLASLGQAAYWLDIKVTAGTNTKTEIAAYLSSIHAMMKEALENVSPTSYVLVHETPAASWGFAGETQEFRFISGRIADRK